MFSLFLRAPITSRLNLFPFLNSPRVLLLLLIPPRREERAIGRRHDHANIIGARAHIFEQATQHTMVERDISPKNGLSIWLHKRTAYLSAPTRRTLPGHGFQSLSTFSFSFFSSLFCCCSRSTRFFNRSPLLVGYRSHSVYIYTIRLYVGFFVFDQLTNILFHTLFGSRFADRSLWLASRSVCARDLHWKLCFFLFS